MSIFGGGTHTKPNPPSATLRVQSSIAGKCIPIVYGQARLAGNLIWYGDFSSRPASGGGGKSGGKGGGGGGKGGKGGSGSYDYSAFVAIGICEGPVTAITSVFSGSTQEAPGSLNFVGYAGTYTQTPWTWLESNYPSQALSYRGLCYATAAPFDLGGSPALPNINFEVGSSIGGAFSPLPDADPSIVVADFLTNANYGLDFPPAFLGNLSVYQSMCVAAGLVVSDALVSQVAANTYLGDLLDATNSEFVWSGGVLTIVPYGDIGQIAAHGYQYSPPSVPQFSLDDDDFMKNEGGSTIGVSSYTSSDPIIVTRKRRSDALNDIKVEYLDRYATTVDSTTGATVASPYNPAIAEAMDDAAITTWGLRPSSTKQMHFFCYAGAAVTAANLQLRRQQVLAMYTFTLDQRYIFLDPMDLVEISDSALGLSNQPVLIKEITENSDGSLTFTAEEYLGYASTMPAHGLQAGSGYVPNYNVAPPATNPPIIFAAPPQIATNQGLEIWIVASGPIGWGGCDVWISGDGDTYLNVGRMVGPCRQGVLTAPVPIGADPDTVDTIAVDMSPSDGELLSGTNADADNANTLCYCDGELIAYSSASLISQYHYNLTTYTRRGLYGTARGAHAVGAAFGRLDSQVFRYAYSVDQIGKPLYVKLTAFNIYGGGEEGLADVTATELIVPAPPPPSAVTGFAVSEFNNIVSFKWNDVNDFALIGYDIGYAPQGTTDWSSFLMLTVAGSGTEMTNAEVPAGAWTFGIRARDIAGQLSSSITTADLAVTAQSEVIAEIEQSPGWLGTLSGFIRHYTGVLVPDDQNAVSYYFSGGWTAWSGGFQPTPVSSASYIAPVIDQGYDANNRVHATIGSGLMPAQSGSPSIALSIDTWLTGGTDPGTFAAWTVDYLNLRYLRAKITYSGISAGAVSYIREFEPIIDTGTPPVTYSQAETIGTGGSTVTFDQPFHIAPIVVPAVVGASPLYATVSSITPTNCVVNVWDHTGTSVGGSVTLQLQGE